MLSLTLALLAGSHVLAGSVTFADVEKIVQDPTREIRSVDDFLAQPEFSRGFLKHFTLMFASRSAQSAAPTHPRVISYGEDTKLILTFTCAPGDCGGANPRGGGVVELVHWKEETKSFEFREIQFPEGGLVDRPRISGANPAKCMHCHMGPDPRPNWESYSKWPGAYGGDDDHLAGALIPGENRALLKEFLSGAAMRPRYRHLEELARGYERNIARDTREHNIDLTNGLQRLNLRRMADRLIRSPHYESIKFAISKTAFTSETMEAQLTFAGLRDLAREAKACLNPSRSPAPPPTHPSHVTHIARLFYALGVNTLPWFMSFHPTLRSEMVSALNTDIEFWDQLVELDPSARDFTTKKVEAEWQELAKRPELVEGFRRCAGAQ